MIDITYFGHSSFKISGKKASIITDPFDSKKLDLKFPKTEASVVLISDNQNTNHNQSGQISPKGDNGPFITQGPGEYEIEGVNIVGVQAPGGEGEGGIEKITVYQFTVDGVRFGFLGNLSKKLSQDQLEPLSGVDVLFVPVGGQTSLFAKDAVEVISQIEPKYIIPMHYKESFGKDGKVEVSSLEEFLKVFGAKSETTKKLSVAKDKLPEEPQVVVLQS
ncbi:MAG TPA: MBL fold metallo-hydrolase [Patescibacteria group bacterium]